MLLKSIKLENFRQFRNESIDFAQGEGGKNVTIIIGENGTGKTTFAQAFFWCLYGETEFSDKIILNKMVATEMTPGSEEKVRVTLALRHGEVDYTLIREQAYHKDYANNVKGDNTVFDIAIKDTSGNTSYVKKSQCEAEVKSILPKELSRYFFFDGERIEKMSKDISTGKKATDFAEAVKGLLGLNAMISAIGHFNPRSSLSVIGSYEKSFDSKSNTKIQEYTAKIDKCNARLAEIDAALEELDTQKAAAETRKSEKVIELKQYSEGKKLQKEKEDLQKQIENTTRMRATVYKTMCKDFNASMSPFFSISLIKRALEVLSRHDYSGKDIPFIRDKTIEYLLKQKVCLCGTHLDEGSVPYEKVKSLLDVIPPKSLSTYVTDFKKESKRRAGALQDLVEQMQENLATASQQSDDIMDKTDELHKIEAKLSGKDVSEKVRAINNEIQICVKTINKCNNDRDKLNIERGGLEKERERADTERQNLTLLDEKNRKTQMYLTLRTLVHLKNSPAGVNITLFSDNVGNNKLHNIEFTDFCKEYPSVKISMKKTGGIFHDRFIVLDYGTADERVFLCGASSKDAGARITSIVEDYGVSKYTPVIATLLKNPTLILPQ